MGIRFIARYLGISPATVVFRVRDRGQKLIEQLRRSIPKELDSMDIIEIDETKALLSKKLRKLWVWGAVSRNTRRILAIETGSRGAKTLMRPWGRIKHLKPFCVATDEWKVYRKVIPKSLLVQTKKLTQTVESVNGQIRNYLARFNRRTKRYTKSPHMVIPSLAILWHQKLY